MKILVFPKGTGNPYQELLYNWMRKEGDIINYISPSAWSIKLHFPTFIPQIILWRLRGYKVIHIHWANAFSFRFKIIAYYHYLLCLRLIHLLGYKLIWTAHNILPHEKTFPDDVIARRKLIETADLIIAHSRQTLEQLEREIAKPKRSTIIPIGSYDGIYPNDDISKFEARKKLGLKPNVFIYLYSGEIRLYKGIDYLIQTYIEQSEKDTDLIITGACQDPELRKILEQAASSSKIIWHDGRVPDDELQFYFSAADVVVLPFKSVTTSSSTLLAFAFGKAVIVPRLGDPANLPDDITYKYSPQDKNGLANAMEYVKNNPEELERKCKAARIYSKKLNWHSIAKQTHEAMAELF